MDQASQYAEQATKYSEMAVDLFLSYLPTALLAVVTLLVGLFLIRRVSKLLAIALEKKRIDVSLSRFLVSFASISLKVLLIVSVISMVGVQTTSVIAVLGAAGFAVGMALQGSLSNFAGGVLILVFRPFKIGDYIEAQGQQGTVKDIQVFCTVLNTIDNRRVIVPNGSLANGVITNFNAEGTRRVDFTFGIGYGDDIAKAKQILTKIVSEDSRIFKDPAPVVAVHTLGDSSVNFTVRVWANATDYWGIYWDTTEKVKITFDREGISIPFPQRDVHVYSTPGLAMNMKAETNSRDSASLN